MNKLFLLAIAGIILISGCVQNNATNNVKSQQPIYINLEIEGEPFLNNVVNVRFIVRPYIDAPNTSINIQLSEGLEYTDGELSKVVDIEKNQTVVLEAHIKAIKTGNEKISAWAYNVQSDGSFGKADILYLDVFENKGTVSRTAPKVNYDKDEVIRTIPIS